MSSAPQPPSRTSSLASESFAAESKRTRKRFAKWQTAALEKLYATTTHPTREEREKLSEHIEAYVSPASNYLITIPETIPGI